MIARRFVLLTLFAASCAPSGTGALLEIDGSLSLDAISVEAQLDGRTVTRDATVSALPTSFLAILPDADASVTLVVRARRLGATIAALDVGPLDLLAHEVLRVPITFSGTTSDGGSDGGNDAATPGTFVVQRGGAPPTGANLTGIWSASADDLYVTSASQGGTNLLHTTNRGASYTTSGVGPGAPDLFAAWSASTSAVFLVGASGALLRGSGGSFVPDTTPAGGNALRAIWGASASDVYVVGDANTILHSVAGGWVQQSAIGANTLRGVWGSDASHVWVVGDGGKILFSTGNGVWMPQASGTTQNLAAIYGASANEIYAVGDGGTILRCNGTVWSAQTSGVTSALRALHCDEAGACYAVGDAWNVLRVQGATPIASGLPTDLAHTGRFLGVAASAQGGLTLVGDGQTILHRP